MSKVTATQARDFLNNLVLPEAHEYKELTAKVSGRAVPVHLDNEASAQVNAGSLTSFTERLTGLNKSDVQNSTLLAQLAANKAINRFEDPIGWYKFYTDVLGNIGWNQPAFAFDTYTSGGTTVNLDKAVLNILSAIATADEIAMVEATMQALESLGDDSDQMNIWDSNASNANNGNFQIFPVDRLANGDVVMVLAGMEFNATKSRKNFLWWSWSSSSIKIERAANKFVLNEDIYSQIRKDVIAKLGDSAATYVAGIEI